MDTLSAGQQHRQRFAFAIIVVTVVLFVAILVYYSTLAITGSSRILRTSKYPSLCKTTDCVEHSRLLSVLTGRNIDPCEDFEGHICSIWRQLDNDRNDPVVSAVGKIRAAWYANLESLLRNATVLIPASTKPLAMFHSCTQKHTASLSDVDHFRSFMSELNLCWPEEPPEGVNPLAVLLDLTFNWGLCFWLRIRLSKIPGSRLGSRIRILLSPGRSTTVYAFVMRYYRLASDEAYARYWTAFRSTLNSTRAPNEGDKIQRNKVLEGKVIKLLVSIINKHPIDPVSVALSNLELFTHPVPSSEWLGQMNKVLHYERPFKGDDEVLASDRMLLRVIGKLFAMFSAGELMSYLSWQFVQAYAPVLDLSLADFPSDTDGRTFCAKQVISSYNPLITAIYMRLNPPQTSHQYFASRMSMVLKHTLHKVVRSSNLDNRTKTATTAKITAMKVHLWPQGELLRNPGNLYSEFPENGTSFVGLWIGTRRSLQKMVSTRYSDFAFSFSVIDAPHMVHYDYITNELEISVVALTSPLYYRNGTNAMFYGGLGFLVAKEVLKMQDSVGARFYANGSVVPIWLKRRSHKLLENQEACLGAKNKLRTYLPALEVSYSALREAIGHTKHPLQLSEDLTEPKAFFQTVCLATCMTRSAERSAPLVKCNHLVQNSFEFADTFGCEKVSRMNNGPKCPYFQR